MNVLNPFILADENYVRWEREGGKDLELSAFRLTNRQMFWLSLANRLTLKIHRNFKITNKNISLIDNLNGLFKKIPGFNQAYKCEE